MTSLCPKGGLRLEEKIKELTPGEERRNFDDAVEFLGYSIDKKEARPGGEINISYFWRSLKKLRADYSVFVHFRKDGATIFQNDHNPLLNMSKWKKGVAVREDFALKIPPDAPAGRYDIIIGIWDPAGSKEGIRLKGKATDELRIGSIEISTKI